MNAFTDASDRITIARNDEAPANTSYLVDGDTVAVTTPLFADGSQTIFAAGAVSTGYATHEVVNTMTGAIYYVNTAVEADALALRLAQAYLFPMVANEQKTDFENAKRYLARAVEADAKFATVRKFIQDSIERDEWTESELEEIFWEELAELLGLDLKQTEEKEITITVTYTATVTVPKGTDLDELELEVESYPEVQLHGTDVGEARRDNLEVSEY